MRVIETQDGWMIQCHGPCKWHQFPKVGKPGASWSFNGDFVNPTFTPSMNEVCNGPGPHHNERMSTTRCHFIVTAGRIMYCTDCTHSLAGQVFDLEPWPQATVDYYKSLMQ